MSEEFEEYDRILEDINRKGYIVATMDSEYPFKCLRRLEDEGLIYKENISVYYLTSEGYRAIRLGGFKNWTEESDNLKKKNMDKVMKISNEATEKKVFISHSSKDIDIVEKVIDILEAIGVPSNRIFCTSFEGYGVKLGQDFLDSIKAELNADDLVLFILSKNFYASPVCLCEMGAAWVRTNQHIPILIPPFDYSDVKGVIPTIHGMKINEKNKMNSLKEHIEIFLGLGPINISNWERKRDNVLKQIKEILEKNELGSTELIGNIEDRKQELLPKNILDIIKELSKKEWPNNYTMQLDYIRSQIEAFENLSLFNPSDILINDLDMIKLKSKKEWPNNFVMQLDYIQSQVESLRELKRY